MEALTSEKIDYLLSYIADEINKTGINNCEFIDEDILDIDVDNTNGETINIKLLVTYIPEINPDIIILYNYSIPDRLSYIVIDVVSKAICTDVFVLFSNMNIVYIEGNKFKLHKDMIDEGIIYYFTTRVRKKSAYS